MPEGVRGSRDYFKERYGLGERLAVRLAALLSHRVALTAAAIECLRESPALQSVILHPELLRHPESLTTASLAAGEPLPAPLVVVDDGPWRTVALEEELLGEGHEGEAAAGLPVLSGKAELLHPTEIGELFSRRDIAELELVLRTSADANEKITALRRLALSPASAQEKLTLFAMALTDRSAEVRGEAAEALTTLGLATEVAEDARALAEGNAEQKRFAIERIGQRILAAEDAEMGVLLRIVAGTLRHEPSVPVRRLLITAIAGACASVAQDSRSSRDLVRILIGQLRDAVDELGPAVRGVLLALGQHNAAAVAQCLDEELATIAGHPIRRLLVAVAGELAASDDARAVACRLAAEEMVASADPAVECLPLGNMLGKSGAIAVAAMGEAFATAPEAAQMVFVRLLDVIATRADTPPALRARIGELLLVALRSGERAARLAVIQSTATMGLDLTAATRAGLAEELVASVAEYANPGIIDAIEATHASLGAPAVEPLLGALEGAERTRQRLSAARVLGMLLPRLEASEAAVAQRAIQRGLELLSAEFPDRPELVRALGRMGASPAVSPADVARLATTLRGLILDKALTHAALDGLAHLCLSPEADAALKVDLADFFARLLRRDLPDIEATVYAAEGNEVGYAFGSDVLAYTEMVPSIIQGLRHIAITSAGVLRQAALDHLLDAWRNVADGTLQLGPGNTQQLLDALHAIGSLPDVEAKQRDIIVEAVALRHDFLPTRRVLAELIVAAGDSMAARAAALADSLLRRAAAERELSPSEEAILLGALVRLATAASLGPQGERLRERTVVAVSDAEKRGLEAAPSLLDTLRASPAIPERLKSRLRVRQAQR